MKLYKRYCYIYIGPSQFGSLKGNSYTGLSVSGDSSFGLCDRGSETSWAGLIVIPLPAWITNKMVPTRNGCLTHAEAKLIKQVQASTAECLDGFYYPEDD